MKKSGAGTRKIKYFYIYPLGIILLIFGLCFFFILQRNHNEIPEFSLKEGEILIDSIIEKPYAYTLVSKNGSEDYGDFFVVFEKKENLWQRIYEKDFKNLKPWKIETADIDGDNTKEILIAVKSTTRYDKELKNRMFIFNFSEGSLVKKWTGSQIAGKWRDFYVGDLFARSGDELIFIEYTDESMEKVSVYSWFDFGFIKIAESEAFERIENIKVADINCLNIIYEKNGRKLGLALKARGGRFEAAMQGEPVH